MRDPYTVLGISRDASADDVKKAYRGLAKQYHPDLNPGDSLVEQRFKEISSAYDLLSDEVKRARYDRGEIDASGAEKRARRRRPSGAGANRQSGFSGFSNFDPEDIFSSWFGDSADDTPPPRGAGAAGRSGRKTPTTKGADVSYAISVGFLEAARGAKRRLNLTDGRAIDISIPPGSEDGRKLRLKGQGMKGMGGGGTGDAIVEIHVEPHQHFVRKDFDIHLDVPITLPEALLGASIKVPTIDGRVTVKVPSGSNTGSVLRLRGRGLKRGEGDLGDQYVKLRVMLPDQPDNELLRFIETWSKTHGYDVRRRAGLD